MKVQRYDIDLSIDHAKLAYSGHVVVHLEHDGGPLVLNSVGLEIGSVASGGKKLDHQLVPEKEELRVEGLAKGPAEVKVAFSAKVLDNALMGFYRSDYGETHALVTQLEPLGARRVIPCVDHPAQKAEFHLSLTVDAGLQAIFNTPVKTRQEEGSRVRFTFEPTPRMSTYLLFMGIGKFEERRRQHGKTEIIVAAPTGRGDQAGFALDHAGKILDFFGTYFDSPYPLPKLHLVAVPNTAVGGMENWGAIAFRERVLLVGPDASQSTKRQVLSVMAHEIAHQWFGDLVTMAWWNDLWLNESFATYMDYKATDHLYPEWHVWSDFAVGGSNAKLWDALPHSHPVNVPVEDPNQISSIFDEISYAKGGCLLRMIESYLGEEVFRRGVARYLHRFAYGNAKGEDLWAALDEEAKQPVSRVLIEWINRPGYPGIEAAKKGEELHLRQKRFLLTGPENGGSAASKEKPWPIPLNVLADGKAAGHLVEGETFQLPLHDASSLILDHGRRSFVRVRYEGDLGRSLRERFASLPPWDRWGLLQDTYAFMLAGEVELAPYLELLRASKADTEYLVLSEALSQIGTLYPVLRSHAPYVSSLREVIVAQSDRLGLASRPGEASREAVLRQRVTQMRVIHDPGFDRTLSPKFASWEKEDPTIREAIAVAYGRTEGAKGFDALLSRLKGSRTDEEKGRLAHAIGLLRDPAAIERALTLPFGGEVSPTTGLEILAAMIGNPDAYPALWGFLNEALPVLMENFGGTGVVPIILQWTVPYLGLGREEELRKFFSGLELGDGRAGLVKGLDLLTIYSRLQRRVLGS